MTSVGFRIRKNMEGDEFAMAVYAEVSASGKSKKSFMIPVGFAVEPYEIELSEGRHLVQVFLPSGELIAHDFEVSASAAPQVVEVPVDDSGHEYLAWPQIMGSVETDLGRFAFESRTLSQPRLLGGLLSRDEQLSGLTLEFRSKRHSLRFDPSGSGEQHRLLFKGGDRAPDHAYDFWTDLDEENLLVRFHPTHESAERSLERRLYLTIHGLPGKPIHLPLPLPWYRIDPHGSHPARLDILVHTSRTADGSRIRLEATPIVHDALIASMTAYLKSGDLVSLKAMSKTALKQAEDMLYHKVTNPVAAALGGLVLFRTRAYERLHHWPQNLANWFEWLPDGAILHAWCCIQGVHGRDRGPKAPDYDRAVDYLLKAAKRGVPFYAESMKLLIDGLKLCRRLFPDNEEVVLALARNRKYAVAIDWDQPFCVFTGDDIEHPAPLNLRSIDAPKRPVQHSPRGSD